MTVVTSLPAEYLDADDRVNACQACKTRGPVLDSQYLSRSLQLITSSDIECFERVCHNINKLQLATNAAKIAVIVKALKELVESDILLQYLQLMNANKLTPQYKLDVYEATVKILMLPSQKRSWSSKLVKVNFQLGVQDVVYPVDRLLHRIGKRHPNLLRLTIDWQPRYSILLSLRFDAGRILHDVNNFRQLTHLDLPISRPALCTGVLEVFGSEDRQPLRYIAISLPCFNPLMRPNNVIDLTPDVWRSFSARQPSVQEGMTIQVNLTTPVGDSLTAHGLDTTGIQNVSHVQMMLTAGKEVIRQLLQAFGDRFDNSLTTFFLVFTAAVIDELLGSLAADWLLDFFVDGVGVQADNVTANLTVHPVTPAEEQHLSPAAMIEDIETVDHDNT